MADVAKSMYLGQPSTSDTLCYTAPAGGAVVRNIHVANTTAADATITIGLNASTTLDAANHFLSALTVPAYGSYDWSGFKVLNASGTIRALQGTSSALTVSIDGVEL